MAKNHYDSHNAGVGWGTPKWVWGPLADSIGGFDLDPASGAEKEPIAKKRYTVEDNGLEKEWFGNVWVNPPYGRKENPKWAKRVSKQWENDNAETITALVPASTDTKWFQDNYANASLLTFIEGRIQFEGDSNHNATFPSVIASYGSFPDEYISKLRQIGTVTATV